MTALSFNNLLTRFQDSLFNAVHVFVKERSLFVSTLFISWEDEIITGHTHGQIPVYLRACACMCKNRLI